MCELVLLHLNIECLQRLGPSAEIGSERRDNTLTVVAGEAEHTDQWAGGREGGEKEKFVSDDRFRQF